MKLSEGMVFILDGFHKENKERKTKMRLRFYLGFMLFPKFLRSGKLTHKKFNFQYYHQNKCHEL